MLDKAALDFLTATAIVFMSEMGDKSQIISFGFGAKQRLLIVLPAIFLGIILVLLTATVIGRTVGALIPYFWIHLLSGLLFFLFGYLSFRGQHEEIHKPIGTKFGAFITIFLTFVISELGDKTVFATMALASHSKNFLAVWLGSTLGMFTADVLAIFIAAILGKALPAKMTCIFSGIIFIVMGIYTIFEGFISR